MNTETIKSTYFNRHNKIGRMSYFLRSITIYLIVIVATFILNFIANSIGIGPYVTRTIILLLIVIPALLFMLYQTMQRQNDWGIDWYWAILIVIPVVGFIWWLVQLIAPGKS